MRRLRIVFLMSLVIVAIQLTVLVFESRNLQTISPKRHKARRVVGGHISDSSGGYFIRRFFKSEGYQLNSIKPRDITLATHCSVDYLHHIIDLIEVWDGPLTIGIFSPGEDAAFAEDVIDGLRLCWPKLRNTASFHFLYPRHEALQANMTRVGSFAYYSCKDITRRLYQRRSVFADSRQLSEKLRYPHNVLRNIAIDGALTDFILSIDIDLIPSKNLRENFLNFASKNGVFLNAQFGKLKQNASQVKNEVYILPGFEVKQSETRLHFKKDVIQLVKESQARSLLQETCKQCHYPTNYEKWYSTQDSEENPSISHNGEFKPGWEPYFIARRDAPRYDENIVRYGYDRLSQICELHDKKYSFRVLSDAFLWRRGFTTVSSMPKAANLRTMDYLKFHKLFLQRLGQSGRLRKTAISLC